MPGRPQRQDQNNDTKSAVEREYGPRELQHFIDKVQLEAGLKGTTIRKVTGITDPIDTQIERLVATREFGVDFLKGMEFNMCFLDLQTAGKAHHQTMSKSLKDAFRLKAERGEIYRNSDAWIIDIFCYDELERPTLFDLAVILLKCLKDRFCSKLATGESPEPFKVVHRSPKGSIPPGFQKTIDILRPLVEQIFTRFPKVSLIFIISGITTDDPGKGRLATLVASLGRIIDIVRITRPQSRIKCIFCGNGFLSTKPGDRKIDRESLLGGVSLLVADQASRIDGHGHSLTAILDRMLILRWLKQEVRWEKININVHGGSDGVNSQALVLASNTLTAR
ncbi:hypothetical protein DPV78_008434 [Talaromyces pinophilus]|nr:hypothetical protein DPV78_008434 [Talaromyces pinophilus]